MPDPGLVVSSFICQRNTRVVVFSGWLLGARLAGMWIGWIEFDVLLGDVHSLKQKRSVVRPIIAEIRRKFEISVAEVGYLDLYRRSLIGVSVIAADRKHVIDVLDAVERLFEYRPEVDLLSAHRTLRTSDDE